nr:spidroin-2-like [Parasteatoda tepidariorum]
MDWFTRFRLSFLMSIFTHSMIALGQASPWSSFRNANAFVESFLESVSQSGAFTQHQLDDMDSIGETIVRAMSVLGGNETPSKLLALNTAFASAVAEIAISDSGGQNVEETTDAIANALSLAFYETTGKRDDTFVNEMKSLINAFADASANAIVHEPANSMSASAKATAATSAQEMKTNVPVKTGRQRTEASASAVASAAELREKRPDSNLLTTPLTLNRSGKGPVRTAGSPEKNDRGTSRPAITRLLAPTEAADNPRRNVEPRKYTQERVPSADLSARLKDSGPSGYKPSNNGPREAEPGYALATASATATEEEYSPKEPDRVPVAEFTNRGPSGYRPSDNGPRGAEPERASTTASATATLREYNPRRNEMTGVPASDPDSRPTDSGPRGNKPSVNGPGEAEPVEALTSASATATGREYSPEGNVETDNVPAARSTNRGGPSRYKPNDKGPRESDPKRVSAAASATAREREYSTGENEEPDRVPAKDLTEGPTNFGPSVYKPSDKDSRGAEPAKVLATASATAVGRGLLPGGNEITERVPTADPDSRPTNSGLSGYKPIDNGLRETETGEASATAAVREYSPERNEKPDRVPAAGSTNRGPSRYKPSAIGPREADPTRVLATASATVRAREYTPEKNEEPDRVPEANSASGPTNHDPSGYKPSDNGSRETEPEEALATASATENEEPDRFPVTDAAERNPNGFKPRDEGPRRAEPRKALSTASATATGREYSSRENEIPDRVPVAHPVSGLTDHGPIDQRNDGYDSRETEPEVAFATASAIAKERKYSPGGNEIISEPVEYEPRRVTATPYSKSADHDPSGQGPGDYGPRGTEPEKVAAVASAAATVGSVGPEGFEPVITRPDEPRQSSYAPVKSGVASAAASAVSAVGRSSPVYEPSDSNDYPTDGIGSEAVTSAVATDEPDKYKSYETRAVSDSSATASVIPERRLRPIRYEPNDIIASSALAAASALSKSAAGRRISSTTSNLVSSKPDNVSNISKALASVISQVIATNTSASGCDVLVQTLFEIVTALIHVLRYARIGNINYDDLSETTRMVEQSIYEIFG